MLTSKFVNTAFLFLITFNIWGQLPISNMYRFTLSMEMEGIKLSNPQYLTAFNSKGYNNQPFFKDNNSLFFTTNYYESASTEIAVMDFKTNTLERLTYTNESEYSPTSVPGKDLFSCVRVESDQKSQILVIYPEGKISLGQRLLSPQNNIGYHNWLNEKEVALFLIENDTEHYLAISNVVDGRKKIILDRIGRTLKVRDGLLYFVHKLNESSWILKSYDYNSETIRTIVKLPKEVEDFEVLKDGSIICGQSSLLLVNKSNETGENWIPVADLKKYGISNITRIAHQDDQLVLVSN